MEITPKMLSAAIKKAVEVGMIPEHCNPESYLRYYNQVKETLKAALNESEG